MPSTHQHDIPAERAIILWGIITGKDIDVGHLLHQNMLRYMRESTTRSIPHASIVAHLCAKVGVDWEDEQVQMPSQDITHATIQNFDDWAGGATHPRGEGFIMSAPAPVPPQPAEAAATLVTSESQDRQMRRLEKVDALHDNFSAFANGMSRALAEAFAQQETLVEWPIFGSAVPYPPPDSPPEEGGHADI